MVEVTKVKKRFELDTYEKFTYYNWYKWYKSVENCISANFNLKVVPLIYVIRSYTVPETYNFTDEIYMSNP